jgi:DNA modification methylase
METDYDVFLKNKLKTKSNEGFEVNEAELNSNLFDFQRFIVKRALKNGKYAIFADCGLGKTIMQLEWARLVSKHTNKPVIILTPLAVSGQTIKEGAKFGIECVKYTNQTDIGVYITNYEQLDNIDCSIFGGVVLDESSILKNFTGVYKNLIIDKFADIHYKLACTATPAPNDLNEIGNHSEFLDVMDANDMRMRWFVRDEGMNNYRLKGHSHSDFYGWISSWASVLRSPADLGFKAKGYDLPKLNYFESIVVTDKKENSKLFNDASVNATEFNSELRITLIPRMELAVDLVNKTNESFIVWVNYNTEEDSLVAKIPDSKAVRGSDKPSLKESRLLGFANNEFRVLITKKKIAQFGLNFQNCNNQIFASLDFSFEGLYQAIRRSYRFGQKKEVNIYIITTDTMQNVLKSINAKQKQFDKMMEGITKEVNKNVYSIKTDYEKVEVKNDNYWIMNGDSCELIKEIEDNSIDLSVFSPPFSTLFTYSDSIRDMGNCINDDEFFEQQHYLLTDLYKKMKNGRLVCVHTKDLARYKNSSGYSGMYDFTGAYHKAMERVGFKYHSKVTIWVDPVLEMQRTKTQRLLYKQLTSDSSYTGIGMPEYVTIFRKWEGDEKDWQPITNKTKQNFDLNTWQKWASPIWGDKLTERELREVADLHSDILLKGVDAIDLREIKSKYAQSSWFDIQRTNVLNNYRDGRTVNDEKHICPLQLDIIERCIVLWSNVGDTVFTPFLGIGSELFQSIKLGRKGVGIELKPEYFNLAKKNLESISLEKLQKQLF